MVHQMLGNLKNNTGWEHDSADMTKEILTYIHFSAVFWKIKWQRIKWQWNVSLCWLVSSSNLSFTLVHHHSLTACAIIRLLQFSVISKTFKCMSSHFWPPWSDRNRADKQGITDSVLKGQWKSLRNSLRAGRLQWKPQMMITPNCH